MGMIYIVIGLMCNSQQCYWASAMSASYSSYSNCAKEADRIKHSSIMYFQTACMVKP